MLIARADLPILGRAARILREPGLKPPSMESSLGKPSLILPELSSLNSDVISLS
jgi:hypothetical protein